MSESGLVLEPRSRTSLRALAEASQEVLDAIPAGVYVVDRTGCLIRYNGRAEAIWGRKPRLGEGGDRYCGSLRAFGKDGEPLPLSEAPMALVLRDGETVRDEEVEIERPDGARVILSVNIDPLRDSRGRLVGAINCFQDITDRVMAQRALQRSQQDLEDFFENGAVGLHLVSADGVILRANQAEMNLLGYTPEEYIGRQITDFHADDEVISDILGRLSCGERLDKYPARLRAKDGSIKHVLITSNVHFRQGEFLNTRCFTVDVTGWRTSEAAQRETERRLEATYERAPVGIAEIDAEGRFLRVNDAFCRLCGFPPDQLAKLSFIDLTPIEDQDEDIAKYRAQVAGDIDGYAIEKRYVRNDGSVAFVQVLSSSVRDEAGGFLYGVRIVQDITERRLAQDRLAQSEQRTRELLEALPVAVYTTDPEGRITFFNEAAAAFAGRRPQIGDAWCVTHRLYELDGTPMPHDACPMAETLKTGKETRGAIALAERPDGTRVPFMPFPKLLRDATGQVTGAINILVDMTERQRAEEEQRILIDELNHRVKNTLATVQSIASQTLRSTPEAFAEKFEARLIAISAAHDLLTRRRWTGVGLGELLDQQLAAHVGDDRLRLEGPEITLSPRAGLMLGMVVHELATNAAKYGALSTGEGRVRLIWSVQTDDRQVKRLRLQWTESGGPPVTPPSRQGFGTRLLRRGVTAELRGTVDLQFPPTGVRCEVQFPVE